MGLKIIADDCVPFSLIQLLISDEIFEEYQRVGELLSNDYPEVDLGPFIELLAINSELVIPEKMQNPVCVSIKLRIMINENGIS